jgi:hypothetical protein
LTPAKKMGKMAKIAKNEDVKKGKKINIFVDTREQNW